MTGGVLFVHNNFPGQFRDLSAALVQRGIKCTAIGGETAADWPGVGLVRYRLSRGSGRDVSRATVYVALKRLEQKGLVTSKLGESTPERGGRAKRFYKLKPNGLKALRESRDMFLSLWRNYESVLDGA